MHLTRRRWLSLSSSTLVLGQTSSLWALDDKPSPNPTSQPDKSTDTGSGRMVAPNLHSDFPRQNPELVRAVVGASHANIDRVRQLVEIHPALAKAAWDWDYGDWETALGAASHTGRADIAELLMKHGARPDIFTFAMLGKLDAVRACVEASPGIQRIHGPHDITLLQHALNAGERAAAVVKYLKSLGDADPRAMNLELSDEQKKQYTGTYRFGDGANDTLEVLVHSQGNLAIRRGNGNVHILKRVEENGFAPAGATAVRVRFRMADGRGASLTVHDPEPVVTATRAS